MIARLVICLTLLVPIVGCSAKAKKLSDNEIAAITYSADSSAIPRKEIQVDRQKFRDIVAQGPEVMNIRLVELFSGNNIPPRYRVMGYNKNGPYGYLGLQIGDVILAANNYIMRLPSMFPTYVRLLPEDSKNGSIHIVRHGQEMILDLRFQ